VSCDNVQHPSHHQSQSVDETCNSLLGPRKIAPTASCLLKSSPRCSSLFCHERIDVGCTLLCFARKCRLLFLIIIRTVKSLGRSAQLLCSSIPAARTASVSIIRQHLFLPLIFHCFHLFLLLLSSLRINSVTSSVVLQVLLF
jgi:hypothetical protein